MKKGRPSADEIGVIVHRVIGELLSTGVTHPGPEQVLAVTRSDLIARAPVYRQAVRQQVLTKVAAYFGGFPLPLGARIAGTEVAVPGGVLDLLLEKRDGRLWSDEIKSGRAVSVQEVTETHAQVERHLAGAREIYGDRFAGVRVVVLTRPSSSYFLTPDGTAVPLIPMWRKDNA